MSRRRVVTGVAVLGGLAASGASYKAWQLFSDLYPGTPYDDLLTLLPDRKAAASLGTAIIAARAASPAPIATRLRLHIGKRPLQSVMHEDVSQGRTIEAGRWIIPETLALLCVLAARV